MDDCGCGYACHDGGYIETQCRKEPDMKNLPTLVTIDEAIGLLVNYRPSVTTDNISIKLEENAADSAFQYQDAEHSGANSETLNELMNYHRVHRKRSEYADALHSELCKEVHLVQQGEQSLISIDDESQKLLTASILKWASETFEIHVTEYELERSHRLSSDRSFSTKYLEMLDLVIKEFYEEGGKEYRSNESHKKDYMVSWIQEIYEDRYPNDNDGISKVICEGIYKITNPNR